MSVLLVNYEPTQWVTDPRVEVCSNREAAIAAAQTLPSRVSFVLERPTDLLGLAVSGPKAPDGTVHRLAAVGLAKIYNAFACRPVRRFSDRTVAADRTEKLLFSKFINERREVEVENVAENVEFSPKFGDRVTLKADAVRGIPEEHGTVLAVSANGGASVEVDPLYRTGADDDGRRDVELNELAPDPIGTVRMPVEITKSKKEIRAEMKVAKDAERAEKKAAKDAEREQKKAEKLAAASERKKTTTGNGSAGRKSSLADDAVITVISAENPKRPGSKAHGYWELVSNGMTVKAALEAGVPIADLRWNQDKGFISISV